MTLARAVIEVPPTGGLDQGKSKFLPVPFHRLENVVYDKTGALQKRQGLTALPTSSLDSYAVDAPIWCGVRGDELLGIGVRAEESPTQPGDAGPYAWSYSTSAESWAPKTPVPSLGVSRMPGVRGQEDLDGHTVVIARIGTVEAIAWRVGTTGYTRIVDRATDAVLLDNIEIATGLPAGPAGKIALFACDGLFTYVFLNGTATQIKQGTINPTTLAAAVSTLAGAHTSIALWDAIPTATGKWCIALVDITGFGTDLVVKRIDAATATVDATAAELGRGGTTASLGYVSGYNYLLLAWDDAVDVRAKHYVETTLATALADWQVEPLATFATLYGVTCNFDDSHRSFVLMVGLNTASEDKLYLRAFDNLGAALMSTRQINHVSAQCKPFRLNGALYVAVARSFVTTPAPAESFGYALLNLSRRFNEIGNNHPAALEGNFAPLDGRGLDVGTCGEHYAWIPVVSGEAWLPILIYSTTGGAPITSPAARSWCDVIQIGRRDEDRSWSSATAQGLLHLGGALTVQYDGQVASEIAWLEPPQALGSPAYTLTYGANGLEGVAGPPLNAYTYYFCWEWVDARGLIHRSRLSAPVVVEVGVSGPFSRALVDFEIKCTNLTRRGDTSNGVADAPRLAVFRTLKNTSGPFYRCAWNGEVNKTGDWSIAYQDSEDDATLVAAGRGEIYTSGGVLENYAPPPSVHVAMGGGRVWLTSAEAREVWASQELLYGEAPAFAPELVVAVDDAPDDLTGTAQLDATRVIFSRSRIFALPAAGGPGLTGAPPWNRPELVQTSCGCISSKSIVEFKDGVFFRAVDTFKLLTRGFQVVDVGEPVRDLTDAYPEVRAAFLDAKRERVVFLVSGDNGSIFLVYDYRHTSPDGLGSWSQWTFEEATASGGACLWQDQIAFAQLGAVNVEAYGATPGFDGLNEATQWVTAVIETPWIRLGALGGYQRVWRSVFELEQLSAFGLQVDVFNDGDDTTPVQTETWSVTQISNLQGLPRARVVMGHAYQKCATLKLRLTDTETAVPVANAITGFRYHGLSLEIGQKRGVDKAEKDNTR